MARRIILNGEEYRYVVGHSFVRITDPIGASRAFSFEEFTGLPTETIERGQWKRWFSVRPSDVVAFIENGYRCAQKQEAP